MSVFEQFTATCQERPPVAFVVLGSGLGDVVAHLPVHATCRFGDIPGLSAASVAGHRGELSLVSWSNRVVLVSFGRLHYYEGHAWDTVTRPIRLAAQLGAKVAILTNAAGGIRDDLVPGSLMPLCDHLEWNRPYPWREAKHVAPYSTRLCELILKAGIGSPSAPGVYCAVTGPNYETPAEIRAMRSQGADAVGMSTSREAIAGVEAGMEVGAVSLITNRAAGLSAGPLDHAEVMAAGKQAAGRLAALLTWLLGTLP